MLQFHYGFTLLIKTRVGHPYDLKIISDILNLSGYLEQSVKAESYDSSAERKKADNAFGVCSLLSVPCNTLLLEGLLEK